MAVLSLDKFPGRHVSVDIHEGKGSVVNVYDSRRIGGSGSGPPSDLGACCYDDGTCDDLTESDCTDAGGNPQGVGTSCADTSCTGACCNGSDCTPDMTKADCESGGGTFQGFGSDCGPNPCCAHPGCAFANPLGDGRWFLTQTVTQHITIYHPTLDCNTTCVEDSQVKHYDRTVDCTLNCDGSGVVITGPSTGCLPDDVSPSCIGYTCVGVYAGCDYLPGHTISGDTDTYEYYCPNGCVDGDNGCEHGVVVTTYSDEVTPCGSVPPP